MKKVLQFGLGLQFCIAYAHKTMWQEGSKPCLYQTKYAPGSPCFMYIENHHCTPLIVELLEQYLAKSTLILLEVESALAGLVCFPHSAEVAGLHVSLNGLRTACTPVPLVVPHDGAFTTSLMTAPPTPCQVILLAKIVCCTILDIFKALVCCSGLSGIPWGLVKAKLGFFEIVRGI